MKANFSYMTITGWYSKYAKILKDFNFNKKADEDSALLLDVILNENFDIKKLEKKIRGKSIFVIGAGPSLSKAIPILKKFDCITKIVADSAVEILEKKGITPDIVVTDLDGDEDSLKKVGKTKAIFLAHAHGDNMAKLHLVENFKNCIGTTQTHPIGRLHNFGGFTDGDRGVFLAYHMQAKNVILFGMDFGKIIGKFSKTKASDKKLKLKKLRRGKELLEWLSKKNKIRFYTTSEYIKGFKKIRFTEIEGIIKS